MKTKTKSSAEYSDIGLRQWCVQMALAFPVPQITTQFPTGGKLDGFLNQIAPAEIIERAQAIYSFVTTPPVEP